MQQQNILAWPKMISDLNRPKSLFSIHVPNFAPIPVHEVRARDRMECIKEEISPSIGSHLYVIAG